ncbi:unnamed protein product [Lampetra fluviatilis]
MRTVAATRFIGWQWQGERRAPAGPPPNGWVRSAPATDSGSRIRSGSGEEIGPDGDPSSIPARDQYQW